MHTTHYAYPFQGEFNKTTITAIKLLILRSFQKKVCAIVAYRLKALPLNDVKYGNVQSHNL